MDGLIGGLHLLVSLVPLITWDNSEGSQFLKHLPLHAPSNRLAPEHFHSIRGVGSDRPAEGNAQVVVCLSESLSVDILLHGFPINHLVDQGASSQRQALLAIEEVAPECTNRSRSTESHPRLLDEENSSHVILESIVNPLAAAALGSLAEDVVDKTTCVNHIFRKFVGSHCHVVAELLQRSMDQAVGSCSSWHAFGSCLEVRSERDALVRVVDRGRKESNVHAGVDVHGVEHEMCAGPMTCSMHRLAQFKDVAPVAELLPYGVGGLLYKVDRGALAGDRAPGQLSHPERA